MLYYYQSIRQQQLTTLEENNMSEKMEKILARVIFYGLGMVAVTAGFMLMFTVVAMIEAWTLDKVQLAMCIFYVLIMVLYGAFIKMLNEKW
jgi:hypothetical protein